MAVEYVYEISLKDLVNLGKKLVKITKKLWKFSQEYFKYSQKFILNWNQFLFINTGKLLQSDIHLLKKIF